jgi:hypothetical protein
MRPALEMRLGGGSVGLGDIADLGMFALGSHEHHAVVALGFEQIMCAAT